jgi:hypothetical protein
MEDAMAQSAAEKESHMLPCRVALGFLLAVVLSWTLSSPVEAVPQAFVSASGDDGTSESNTENNCSAGWPCRSFARALAVVDDGGEVVALSSGDYERFTVRKPVSVVAAPGVHAVITVTSSNAIAVATSGAVTLRGLTLNGRGATNGINVVAVDVLHVEDCILDGFIGNAIGFGEIGSITGQLHLRDTAVTNSGSDFASAVFIAGGAASINRLRMEHNRHGVVADGGTVAIRDSIAAWQTEDAVWARGHNGAVDLTIENCTIMGPATGGQGIVAGDSVGSRGVRMSVSNSTVMNHLSGIVADQSPGTSTKVWVSNTTITLSGSAIFSFRGAAILSRGNNTLEGNNNDGGFTAGFSAK